MAQTNNDLINKALGELATFQVLVDNFPNSVVAKLGIRTETIHSPLELILKTLNMFGLTEGEIIKLIVSSVSGLKKEEVDAYVKNAEAREGIIIQSEFIEKLEHALHIALKASLIGSLSCGVNPLLPDDFIEDLGGYTIPLEKLDLTGTLRFPPCSKDGKYYYSNEASLKSPSELYTTGDFNAYLWYIVNKSTQISVPEINKCMWDNRNRDKNPAKPFNWGEWVTSRKVIDYNGDDKFISPDGFNRKPILRVEYDEQHNTMLFGAAYQEYYKQRNVIFKGTQYSFNKTIFEFNRDYIDSLKILDGQAIIGGLLHKYLISIPEHPIPYDTFGVIISEYIDTMVDRLITYEDIEMDDSFYEFSNDALNDALANTEAAYMGGVRVFGETSSAAEIDAENVIENLNNYQTATNKVEEESYLTKALMTLISTSKTSVNSTPLNYDIKWLLDFIKDFVKSICLELLKPSIMTIYLINYSFIANGLNKDIGIKQIISLAINSLLQSLMGWIKQTIKVVIKMITDLLTKLFLEKIKPILVNIKLYLTMEQIQNYLDVLTNMLETVRIHHLFIPQFRFNNRNEDEGIDDVSYADIIPTS